MIKDVAVNKYTLSCLKKVSNRIGGLFFFFQLGILFKHLELLRTFAFVFFFFLNLATKMFILFSVLM